MTAAATVYLKLQRVARDRKRPADEIFTLYGLERFLARLAGSPFAEDFCLKGGVLLSAHALRRPTRDVDMQALDFQLDVDHVTEVVKAVCDVVVDDGLVFDHASMQIEQIRDEDEYTGLRVSLPAVLGRARITIKLDISTGDPIWPEPEQIELPSLLGGTVRMKGHPLVTVIAEKTVTMLQRGTTSTRWRDLLDVAVLSDRFQFDAADLREAAAQVAAHRGAELGPLRTLMDGYGATGQAKWAAWRRKLKVEDLCEPNLDAQVERVLTFIEPVFDGSVEDHHRWSPDARSWS
ncbi:nucleotidyl transferase AbiEii/AbiGii toxin family protein [Arthrobacter terricola]|uniref:nucleotidyl transferase AbiEii/AbiGii toxin family protein n=1 Tax=Arthrobacter terricola TaxID=2547396 RepID=UPI001405054E|nr:nucleotidyl transferase AbiEii/AbiGii toxin family protein [Arthrobacter terricola]